MNSMESQATAHEQGLSLFISREWRHRFRESLDQPQRRRKMLMQLYHFRHLDSRFREPVARRHQRSSHLLPILRRRGAPAECYLLSTDETLDGSMVTLSSALLRVVDADSFSATFISCIPGRLAYFHEEEEDNRCLLYRCA